MAIEDIEQMTRSLSNKGEKEVAMSDPDPSVEQFDMMDILAEKHFGKSYDKLTPKEIELLEENWDELISKRKQQGITQVAAHSSEDSIMQSAILWAAGLPQFGSIDAVVQSLQDGSTDMNGLINAYMDARTEIN